MTMKRYYNVVKLLNYAFFDKHQIEKLTDMTVEIAKAFVNDYGLGNVPGDDDDIHRSRNTVEKCVSDVIDFLTVLIRENILYMKSTYTGRSINIANLRKNILGRRFRILRSCIVVPLFYTTMEVYTKFGMVSANPCFRLIPSLTIPEPALSITGKGFHRIKIISLCHISTMVLIRNHRAVFVLLEVLIIM